MIDEKVTLQLDPKMPLIMFNQDFIEHLLLIIFNRLQCFFGQRMILRYRPIEPIDAQVPHAAYIG